MADQLHFTEPDEDLWPELKVEHHWFHIVRAMILRGKIAEMGVHAWAVYCVLKSYTALNTDRAWPSQQKIAEHLGLSTDTVMRSIERLVQLNVINKRRIGKRNEYELMESVPISDPAGNVVATGRQTYTPMAFQSMMNELKEFARSGSLPAGGVKIELSVNFIQQGDHGTVNINTVRVSDGEGQSERYEELFRRLRSIE